MDAASLRDRQPGIDVLAVLALVGTLVTEEYLAGARWSPDAQQQKRRAARAGAGPAPSSSCAPWWPAPRRSCTRYEGDVLAAPRSTTTTPEPAARRRHHGEVLPVDGQVEGGGGARRVRHGDRCRSPAWRAMQCAAAS
ncbi:MAG: hypothetical protein U0W40_06560 [Acidimicrobiia bacterium]